MNAQWHLVDIDTGRVIGRTATFSLDLEQIAMEWVEEQLRRDVWGTRREGDEEPKGILNATRRR